VIDEALHRFSSGDRVAPKIGAAFQSTILRICVLLACVVLRHPSAGIFATYGRVKCLALPSS
jgi:hypothetical protein